MRLFLLILSICTLVAAPVSGQEPNLAVIPAPRDDFGTFKRYLWIKEQAAKESPGVVFLGDSITQAWDGAGKQAWDQYFGDLKPFNAGISGDRTEHILWRIEQGGLDFREAPQVCVLMIGTNNTGHRRGHEAAEHTAEGIELIAKALHAKYPRMQILLLGILPRGADNQDALRIHNAKINAMLAGMKLKNVTYLDIADAFLDADGVLSKDISPDLLHFNPEGYDRYAKAILPSIKQLMK